MTGLSLAAETISTEITWASLTPRTRSTWVSNRVRGRKLPPAIDAFCHEDTQHDLKLITPVGGAERYDFGGEAAIR